MVAVVRFGGSGRRQYLGAMLAPDIQEAILEGRQAKGIQLDELIEVVPGAWGEQRRVLQAASSASSAR